MSVFPNDYVRLIYPDKITEGYYCKYDISAGSISLMSHNQASKNSYTRCYLGLVAAVKKLNISILGDNYIEE